MWTLNPDALTLASARRHNAPISGVPSTMASPAPLEASLKRLTAALDQLEAASERLARAGADKRDLEDTLAVMQDDRGRLAQELDAATTRTQALEHATDEVVLRLRRAGTSLRHMLAADA